ncbi:hypothetical protein CEXT_202231 [Caerostris extrusa]|uniref:Uncharacterized protein n=1 Tax=Caerostris extrusa TaxID=172846 RepID=A0AAV4T1V8_CAEEX|nr:hypothetical protein CEXT_202231 [Caerostris extrusa]
MYPRNVHKKSNPDDEDIDACTELTDWKYSKCEDASGKQEASVSQTKSVPKCEVASKNPNKWVFCKKYYTSAKIELEYTMMYGVLNKNLKFATDVMLLVRHFNLLQFNPILYKALGGKEPSPWDKWMDDALNVIWTDIKDGIESKFNSLVETASISYEIFQIITIYLAQENENEPYSHESFLYNCVVLCHWAVCAEHHGVKRASQFTPLILCRIIEFFTRSGDFTPNSWKSIAGVAADIAKARKPTQ